MPPRSSDNPQSLPGSDHCAAWSEARLLAECETRRTRRSGPGGQHRNKVESAVVLTHKPTRIGGEASERRSQHENHAVALFRLRINLALEHRIDPADSPSPLWSSRCVGGKISINPEHQDFPALLAEALDVTAAQTWDVKSSAEQLGSTTSQLVTFFQKEPRALAMVNRHRKEMGLAVLQ